jgi:pimeloyl-ACP methyl ester carboxylesterase
MKTHQASLTRLGWTLHGNTLESARAARIVPERGQPCPHVSIATRGSHEQGCSCAFGCGIAALRRHPALASAAAGCFAVWFLTGCAGPVAPIGADKVSTRQAYGQVEANALSTGKPSADTVSILHRFDLDRLAAKQPDEAVRRLHEKAVATGERNVLFALAEMSYVAGEHIRRSVKPWDPRDARDYYLGSAVYAWLFLFRKAEEAPPSAFDRRFRAACDLYNYGLGLALTERRDTNAAVRLEKSRRRLPVGEIELQLDQTNFPAQLDQFDQIVLADQFRVRGLSVRNREPGLGAPLICVSPLNREFNLHPAMPATAFLRGPDSLAEISAGNRVCSLELYSNFGDAKVAVGNAQLPLEIDLTAYRAYTLNQSRIWKLGWAQFLAPTEQIRSQLIMNQPFEPDRIPVVFVHGTFSSPVTWAEMANSLTADPVLRQRYQIWSFVYSSSRPLNFSIADLRAALTERVQQLDPKGTNAMLRQMVVIGHSQGGLLTKGTAVDTGDRLWRMFSTNRLEDLKISEEKRAELRRLIFYEPLPFVKRVVFISTPHRGSYLANNLARRLGQKLVALPRAVVSQSSELIGITQGSEVGQFLPRNKIPTSLDGMSPKNPGLLAVAEIPVAPEIKAHSIVSVLGDGDPNDGGKDGVVAYKSAHVDYVESELVVRGKHTCLNLPTTIEEVRRILHLHLEELSGL